MTSQVLMLYILCHEQPLFLNSSMVSCLGALNLFFQDFVQDKNSYTIRNRNHLQIPQTKAVRSDFNPSVACSEAWNPDETPRVWNSQMKSVAITRSVLLELSLRIFLH